MKLWIFDIKLINYGKFECQSVQKKCCQGWAGCELLIKQMEPEKLLTPAQQRYVWKLQFEVFKKQLSERLSYLKRRWSMNKRIKDYLL